MNLTAVQLFDRDAALHRAHNKTIARRLLMALCMAAVIGLAAQIRIYTPWSPVPVTGQTFAVLLAGAVMRRNWGGITLAVYIMLGLCGVPWFVPQTGMAPFTAGGMSHLLGPTGGYLAGFVAAAIFIGHFREERANDGLLKSLALMLFASLVIIYVPGLIWLGFWLNATGSAPVSWLSVMAMGALPFVAGDIMKAGLAALASKVISHSNLPRS
jgi:biotin transport system substrate-specific component